MATKGKKSTAKKSGTKKNTRKKNTGKAVPEKNWVPLYIISMMIITILLAVLMYIDYGEGGYINVALKTVLCGLFGMCGFFVPAISAGLTVYLVKTKDTDRFWLKLLLSMLALVDVSAMINLSCEATSYSVFDAFVFGHTSLIGGGFLGACVSIFLNNMVQKIAAYIILIIGLIVLATFISHVSIVRVAFEWIRNSVEDAKVKYDEIKEEREREAEERAEYEHQNDPLGASKSLSGEDVPRSKRTKKANKTAEPEILGPAEAFENGISDIFGDVEVTEPKKTEPKKEETFEEVFDKIKGGDKTDKQAEKTEKAEKITEKEKEHFSKEINDAIEQPKIEYVAPPVNLLDKPKAFAGDKRDEMRQTAEKLIMVLDEFGVKARLVQVTQGPTVTRYEIQPEAGVKLSKIEGLSKDIALNLAVETVLVAPVPGKAAVGIEIPNKSASIVSIREMLESDEFKHAKSKLTVALGKDIGGKVVVCNIEKMPHILIAGSTNSGKSVCINTIIMSLLYKATPDEVRLIMIDPKEVELSVYNSIPHLLVPVVSDPRKAAGSLNWAVAEMERRYKLLAEVSKRNIEGYNKLMETTGGEKLPMIVIIIDELADLMMAAAKEVETYICRIAQKARAAGIHLILATQRPSADVITGLIRTNVPSRIAFAVATQMDSRIILDSGGAEHLLGRGDMLYHPIGGGSTRVQGAFVSDKEVDDVVSFIREHTGETSYSQDLADEIERHATGENGVTPDVEEDGDERLQEAIELAVELGKISTSMIQRKLGVGYARAGRIIDSMEARGIVSPANGSKPRDVLVTYADLHGGSNDSYADEYEDEEDEE